LNFLPKLQINEGFIAILLPKKNRRPEGGIVQQAVKNIARIVLYLNNISFNQLLIGLIGLCLEVCYDFFSPDR